MKKIYLLKYDTDLYFNHAIFHRHISSLYPSHISDWWQYMSNTYLIVSSLSVDQLYNLIVSSQILRRYLLIIEVNPNNAQGWLPKKAWEWIEHYQKK